MRRRGALVVTLLGLACAHASATDTACPARHDGQPLVSGQVLDGPLQDNAILVPDSGGTRHGVDHGRWDVGYVYDAGRKVTLDCRYGAGKVSVPMAVETRVETCSSSESKNKAVVLGCK